jgi:surfeit locus 1 family protein
MQRLIIAVAALALALGTARLGFWQLDRAAQKRALADSIAARQAEPPLPAAELADNEAGARQQVHRRTVLRGRWLAEHTVLLDNRQMNKRPGFFVLTPLELADGSAVVVQRGWLPRDPADRTRAVVPALVPGEVEVAGRLAPPPSRLLELGSPAPAESGPIRQNLDLAAFSAELRRRLRPLSLQQDKPAAASGNDALQRDWPEAAVDLHKHHGYAFQWFALSALTVALYVWFQLVQPRRRQRQRPPG